MTLTIKSNTKSAEIEKMLAKLSKNTKFDSSKYLGKILLKKDPLKLQKEMRDEWN